MNKKEFAQMLATTLDEMIENNVIEVESDTYYNDGATESSVQSTLRVNQYYLEEYLKTL